MPLFSARCSSRSSSCPVARRRPNVRWTPPFRSYSATSAPVSGCDIRIEAPVYCSDPMPFSTLLSRTTRAFRRPGRRNPPMRKPAGVKIWMRSRPVGASATTKVPFGSTANAVGSMMRPSSPPMWTISHALDCSASTPKTTCERRSKTKYWPDADCWNPAASRNRPAMCAGTAPTERRTSGARALTVAATSALMSNASARLGFGIRDSGFANPAAQRTTNPESQIPNPESVPRRFADRLQDVVRLREDGLLEVGGVRDRRAERADAAHGRVEVLEQLAGDSGGELGAEAAHHLILVRDDDAARTRDERGNRVPVVGHDRAQIEHRDADVILLRLLRRQERSLHERAPRDDEHMVAVAPQARLAERDHEVAAWVLALVVGLAVEMFVLEEEHRIVAADRRAQQARGIDGRRRIHDADAGAVREDALARLAVIRAAAAQVAADRHADHDGRRPVVARSVAHHRQLVANLHHRRPDVVEELNLDDRLQLAHRHAGRAADDARFGERRVEHAIVAVGPLQAGGQLADAALVRAERQRLD